MNSNWPFVRLGSFCLKIGSGATPKGGKNVYIESGNISLIRSQNIYNDGFRAEGLAYITDSAADKLSNVEVQSGDVLINITGDSVARVCLAPNEYLPARVNQHVSIIRPNQEEFDPRFLKYFLSSPAQQKLLLTIASAGATRNALTKTNIENLIICKPSLNTQKWIADQLEPLDKKICINNQINQTLEQMAQSLFKSWFVDFEPVKAKIAVLNTGGSQEDATLAAMSAISGKNIRSLDIYKCEHPKKYEELRATANLFPNTLVESEVGEIPEGWESVRLSDIAILKYGKALKKTERIDGLYPVYGSGGKTGFHNDYLVTGPGIIIGRKGSIGTIYWEDGNFFPIDTVYYVINKKDTSIQYLYYLLQTLNLSNMNTDAAVPGLNRENVYRLNVLKPKKCIIECYSKYISTFRNSINANKKTNETIVAIRNKILPKLLSGELSSQENL